MLPRRRSRPSLSHVLIVHLLCALIDNPASRWVGPATADAFATRTDRYRPHSRSLIIGRSSSEQPIDDITTQRVDPLAVPLVNAFYKAHKYKGKAKRSDVVFVAKRSSAASASPRGADEIVGAVRLMPKTADTYFIRNLFVAEDCRRKGVGKLLMKAALDGNIGQAIGSNNNNNRTNEDDSFRYYCFLRRELSPIYRAAGLDVMDCQDANLPEWIREEYLRIRQQQSGRLILMGRGILVLPRDVKESKII